LIGAGFGKVIIVSKEEGFGESLKVKMKRYDAIIDNIDVANFISLEQIYENIPHDEYNFVVLDSLGKLEIDTKALEQLQQHYSNSAIIAIAQSTKDGKMRGSNEVIHYYDIEIVVSIGRFW
jgi:predicted ATP-dependent serine protease